VSAKYTFYVSPDLHKTLLGTGGVSCEICTSYLLKLLSKIVLAFFVVMSGGPGKS